MSHSSAEYAEEPKNPFQVVLKFYSVWQAMNGEGSPVVFGMISSYVLAMSQDRKNLLIAICLVIFAVMMAGLTWFLRFMGLEFVLGAVFGVSLMLGCFGIISREFRNLS